MEDLIALTQQRLDYFESFIKLIPEGYFEESLDNILSDGTAPTPTKGLIHLDLPLNEFPEWMVPWINLARWNGGLLPGWDQVQTPEQRERLEGLYATFQKLWSRAFELNDSLGDIFSRIYWSFQKNKWVHDFLREDQIYVVNQARQYLAYNAAAYTQTFYQNREDFLKISPSLKTFLNEPILQKDLNNANLIEAPTCNDNRKLKDNMRNCLTNLIKKITKYYRKLELAGDKEKNLSEKIINKHNKNNSKKGKKGIDNNTDLDYNDYNEEIKQLISDIFNKDE
jgi:hypothetical protein